MTRTSIERSTYLGPLLVLLGLAVFLLANGDRTPRLPEESELSVAPPIPLQLLATLGDRYLAANVTVWRSLMVGTGNLPRETLMAQAKVQEDASFFNPGNEDNYVIATAMLPWEGIVSPVQTILRRATAIRKTDPYAPFFYGFNQIHFLNDPIGAYEYGRIAASHAQDGKTRQALTVISAGWLERGDDPSMSVRILRSMADETRDPGLKRHLLQRVQRQEIIVDLQSLVGEYIKRFGHAPARIVELVEVGFLEQVPKDPIGTVDFLIDRTGKVRYAPKK